MTSSLSTLPPYIIRKGDNQWLLMVKVQPGAKFSEIAGEFDGRLRIKLTAQPIENKANKALVSFIGKLLGLRPAQVTLVSGDTGRQKKLLIDAPLIPDFLKKLGIS